MVVGQVGGARLQVWPQREGPCTCQLRLPLASTWLPETADCQAQGGLAQGRGALEAPLLPRHGSLCSELVLAESALWERTHVSGNIILVEGR